jgi:hypothetical protein
MGCNHDIQILPKFCSTGDNLDCGGKANPFLEKHSQVLQGARRQSGW